MPYDEKLAERVRAVLSGHPTLVEKKMFGGVCFLLQSNMSCGISNDELMVRVGVEEAGEALADANARPMDLAGRPTKSWVLVAAEGLTDDEAPERWVLIVPAVLLVSLTAAFIGFVIGHLSPSVVLTGVLTNVIIFAPYLFSPVVFPQDCLPQWIELVHNVLPIKYMMELVRGALTDGLVDDMGLAFAVVGAWAVFGAAISFTVVNRRR